MGDVYLNLSYRFEPTHLLDGVTLTVPLPLAARFAIRSVTVKLAGPVRVSSAPSASAVATTAMASAWVLLMVVAFAAVVAEAKSKPVKVEAPAGESSGGR